MSLGMILADLKEALLRHPRVTLGVRPTPLHAAPRFSSSVGAEVWLKRDDLTGIATGGNKVSAAKLLGISRATLSRHLRASDHM